MLQSVILKKALPVRSLVPRRFKHKRKLKVSDDEVPFRSKSSTVTKALQHFDDFYAKQFGKLWPSARLAVLSEPKYCALVNYYGENQETEKKLKDLGCIDVSELFSEAQKGVSPPSKSKKIVGGKSEAEVETVSKEHPEDQGMSDRVILPGLPTNALYDFVPVSKIKGMEEWVEEEDQLRGIREASDFAVTVENDDLFGIPPFLKAYCFPRGDVSRFPSPRAGDSGNLDYYLMDGASLLPVIALNLQPRDEVLDLCAAPGGKSLAILQTVYIDKLVCNDATPSRLDRVRSVFQQYLGSLRSWRERLVVTMNDGRLWSTHNAFDKVLVDVPCTNDRHSVTEESNNIFKPSRMKERIKIPELQTDLLCAGIRACKPGGTTVYSTCSLSPIQNDGVVHMAIKRMKQEHNIDVTVKNFSRTMVCFNFMFRFAPATMVRYGQLVIPALPNNFGPMYISKLQRLN